MAKVTDTRLDKLEKSSTDQGIVEIRVVWSDDVSSTDEDVIHVSWDDHGGLDD